LKEDRFLYPIAGKSVPSQQVIHTTKNLERDEQAPRGLRKEKNSSTMGKAKRERRREGPGHMKGAFYRGKNSRPETSEKKVQTPKKNYTDQIQKGNPESSKTVQRGFGNRRKRKKGKTDQILLVS